MQWSTRALLFDLDGTLVESEHAIAAAWTLVAKRHSLGVEAIIRLLPGRRAIDVLSEAGVPVSSIPAEIRWLEEAQRRPEHLEPIRGASRLVQSLHSSQWAVVTAAPETVARARLDAAGLPHPEVLVTADTIGRGKPAPDGYLTAADALEVHPQDCVVFEDSDVGVAAGRAAGCRTIGVRAVPSGADEQIADYGDILGLRTDADRVYWSIDLRSDRRSR